MAMVTIIRRAASVAGCLLLLPTIGNAAFVAVAPRSPARSSRSTFSTWQHQQGRSALTTTTTVRASRYRRKEDRDLVVDNDDGISEATYDPLGLTPSGPVPVKPLKLETLDDMIESKAASPFVEQPDQQEADEQEIGIWAARGLLLLVAAIWGTNFASIKYLSTLCFEPPCHHFPSEAAFARFGLAAVASIPLLLKKRGDVILGGLECGMWISLGYAAQAVALTTISAGKCAFICSLTVVLVPLISTVVFGKPLKPMNIVAAAVALSGVGVLEGLIDIHDLLGIKPAIAATADHASAVASSLTSASSSSTVQVAAAAGPLGSLAKSLGLGRGDIFALGQPIGFGVSFMRIEHYQEKFKDVPDRVLTIAAAQCVAVGLLSLFWVLYDYNWTLPDFSYMLEPHRMAAVGWTGIVSTLFAIMLEGVALQKASATDAAITFSSEPIWASIFGFLLLHEKLGINSYVGGSIILTACLLGSFSDMLSANADGNNDIGVDTDDGNNEVGSDDSEYHP